MSVLNIKHKKAKADNSYKEMFFWFVLAFLISLIILVASVGNFTGVLTWVFGGPDGKIAGASVIDSVANSYSLIFGIPVALAGSIVAIKLAQRAVAVSERQEFYENVKLIDEDIHKLEENNRLLADSIRRFASFSFRLKAFVYEQLLQSASGKSVDIEMPSEEGFAELLKGKTFSLLCEKLIKEKENLVNCAVLGFQNPAIFDYIKGVDKFELEDVAGEVVLEAHNRNARAEAAYNGSDSWDLMQNALKKQTSSAISNLTDAMFFIESHLVSEDTILEGLYDYFKVDKPFTYRYSMLDTENETTKVIDRDRHDDKLLDKSLDFHKLSKLRDMNYVENGDILLAGKLLCSEKVSFRIGLGSYKRPEINIGGFFLVHFLNYFRKNTKSNGILERGYGEIYHVEFENKRTLDYLEKRLKKVQYEDLIPKVIIDQVVCVDKLGEKKAFLRLLVNTKYSSNKEP